MTSTCNKSEVVSLSSLAKISIANAENSDEKKCYCDYGWLWDSCSAGTNSEAMCASGSGTIDCSDWSSDC